MTRYAITKSISIDAPFVRVLLFLSDPVKWPRWTTFNVRTFRPIAESWWAISTPMGPAELRLKRNSAVGTFEYVFTINNEQWSVPGRVLQNGVGSELVLTLFQHETVSMEEFQKFSLLVNEELVWLKTLLELH